LVQHDHAVAEEHGFVQIVGHHHHGHAMLLNHAGQGVLQFHAGKSVHRGKGLVQQQQPWPAEQAASDCHTLSLPA
jgi:hypothetical protein